MQPTRTKLIRFLQYRLTFPSINFEQLNMYRSVKILLYYKLQTLDTSCNLLVYHVWLSIRAVRHRRNACLPVFVCR